MESILLNYLEKIDKYLKPLAAAERADIINEIKSEMLELEAKDKLTSAQIVERLGNPKELAKAYLGQSITQNNGFNIRKLGTVIVFYSLAGLGSIFILPVISILAVTLVICGVQGAFGPQRGSREPAPAEGSRPCIPALFFPYP